VPAKSAAPVVKDAAPVADAKAKAPTIPLLPTK
jgi:hypothetical protein